MEFIDQFEVEKDKERSLLLTWMCIATWIGCWFSVMYYGLHILKISDIERSIYHFDEWKLEYDHMKVSLIAPVFSGVGAFIMWKLNKVGLFVYAAGQMVPAFFGLYLVIFVRGFDEDSYVPFYWIGYFVIQLAFVVLYAIQWKNFK